MKRIIIAFIIVLSMTGVSCEDYLDDLALQSGLNEGLVAYWLCNGYSDTFFVSGRGDIYIYDDYLSNENYLSMLNIDSTAQGIFGKGIKFLNNSRGGSSLLKVPEKNGLSVSFWVNVSTFVNQYIFYNTMFSIRTNAANTIQFNFLSNSIETNEFQNNKWVYVTCTYDGNVAKLYIDSILKSTLFYTGSIVLFNQELKIGNSVDSATGNWQGLIDEIRLYNRALSQKEIQALMKIEVD